MSSSTEESLAKRTNESSLKEYEQQTYEELSKEFKELYRAAARAFELIPLMYNRLMIIDGLAHKEAVAKIHSDHNHLSGFTQRNIRRYLPGDNPSIPRRVRTSHPKNSITETAPQPYFSYTRHDEQRNLELLSDKQNDRDNDFVRVSYDKTAGNRNTTMQITPVIKKRLQTEEANNTDQTHNLVYFEFRLEYEDLRNYLDELHKLSRTKEVWFNGELDRQTQKVIAIYTGTKEDRCVG
jgi:hypothetical protein